MITNKSRIQRKISISLNKKKLSSLHKTNNEIEVLTKLAAKNPKITKLGLAPVTNSPTAKVFFLIRKSRLSSTSLFLFIISQTAYEV